MMNHLSAQSPTIGFEMRFPSLFKEGRGLAFPCDAQGRVDLDGLPRRARDNYFFARTLIGREFATPRVCRQSEVAEAVVA